MVYEAYNLSAMGNSSGILELMQFVNSELMFDFMGIGILLSIFLISLFAFIPATGGNAMKALAGASFIAFTISILLTVLELIPNYVMYVALILAAISILAVRNT